MYLPTRTLTNHRQGLNPEISCKLVAAIIVFCVAICNAVNSDASTPVRDSLEFSKGVYVSPEYLLQGTVSGVRLSSGDGNIAGALTTTIRSHNSSFITSNPIWVIDGTVLSDCSLQFQDAFDRTTYGNFNYTSKVSQLDFLNLYDIESIQVLKNVSETSRYGSRGANGVVIITTRQGLTEKPSIIWHSNIGMPFRNGLTHNHDISIGYNQKRASLRISAFYRDFQGSYTGSGFDRNGGARLNFDLRSNNNLWLGFNVFAAMGRQRLQSAAANYGVPTMGLALQGIAIADIVNTIEGWAKDHDDYANYFRTNGNIWLQLNFLKCMTIYLALDGYGPACNVTGDGAVALIVDRIKR